MSIRPNLNYPENMVWSLEPLQISSGRVTNGRILFLKSSKAGGLNFGAGGPYGPVQIRDIHEFRLYGRPRLTASIPDIVRPDAYSALDSRYKGNPLQGIPLIKELPEQSPRFKLLRVSKSHLLASSVQRHSQSCYDRDTKSIPCKWKKSQK